MFVVRHLVPVCGSRLAVTVTCQASSEIKPCLPARSNDGLCPAVLLSAPGKWQSRNRLRCTQLWKISQPRGTSSRRGRGQNDPNNHRLGRKMCTWKGMPPYPFKCSWLEGWGEKLMQYTPNKMENCQRVSKYSNLWARKSEMSRCDMKSRWEREKRAA